MNNIEADLSIWGLTACFEDNDPGSPMFPVYTGAEATVRSLQTWCSAEGKGEPVQTHGSVLRDGECQHSALVQNVRDC